MPHFRARWRHLALENKRLRLHPSKESIMPEGGGPPVDVVRMQIALEPVFMFERKTEEGAPYYTVEFPGETTVYPDQPSDFVQNIDEPHPFYPGVRIKGTKSYKLDQVSPFTCRDVAMYPSAPGLETFYLSAVGSVGADVTFDGGVYYGDGSIEPVHTVSREYVGVYVKRMLDTEAMEDSWSVTGVLKLKYVGGRMDPEPRVVSVSGGDIVTEGYVAVDDKDDFPRSDYFPRVKKED